MFTLLAGNATISIGELLANVVGTATAVSKRFSYEKETFTK